MTTDQHDPHRGADTALHHREEDTVTDIATIVATNEPSDIVKEGTRHLSELHDFYLQQVKDFDACKAAGQARIDEVTADVAAENQRMLEQVNEAADEFNSERKAMCQTGWASNAALTETGLPRVKAPKK